MEQSGIYRIDLYENNGIQYVYQQDELEIYSVITSGEIISLTQCENNNLNFIDKEVGKGRNLKHEYEIAFYDYDLTDDTLDNIETLNNINGWIAVLYFRKQEKRILQVPLFFNQTELDINKTHYFEISLKTQQLTEKVPIIFDLVNVIRAFISDKGQTIESISFIEGEGGIIMNNTLTIFSINANGDLIVSEDEPGAYQLDDNTGQLQYVV